MSTLRTISAFFLCPCLTFPLLSVCLLVFYCKANTVFKRPVETEVKSMHCQKGHLLLWSRSGVPAICAMCRLPGLSKSSTEMPVNAGFMAVGRIRSLDLRLWIPAFCLTRWFSLLSSLTPAFSLLHSTPSRWRQTCCTCRRPKGAETRVLSPLVPPLSLECQRSVSGGLGCPEGAAQHSCSLLSPQYLCLPR